MGQIKVNWELKWKSNVAVGRFALGQSLGWVGVAPAGYAIGLWPAPTPTQLTKVATGAHLKQRTLYIAGVFVRVCVCIECVCVVYLTQSKKRPRWLRPQRWQQQQKTTHRNQIKTHSEFRYDAVFVVDRPMTDYEIPYVQEKKTTRYKYIILLPSNLKIEPIFQFWATSDIASDSICQLAFANYYVFFFYFFLWLIKKYFKESRERFVSFYDNRV